MTRYQKPGLLLANWKDTQNTATRGPPAPYIQYVLDVPIKHPLDGGTMLQKPNKKNKKGFYRFSRHTSNDKR